MTTDSALRTGPLPHPDSSRRTPGARRDTLRGPTPLERLVVCPSTFAEQAWGRVPHLSPLDRNTDDTDRDMVGLLSVDDVDRFLANAVRRPSVRMVQGGSVLDPTTYCTPTRVGGQLLTDVIDGSKVAEQVAAGATLVLQSLHRQWQPIVRFADDLMGEIGHPVQINAYLTPDNASGLRPHRDDHDVFVVQTAGRKEWSVDGLGDVQTEPGDVLYIPAGCEHAAQTTTDMSLHLTIGVLRITYRSVLERMLADGPSILDRPVPLGFHNPGSSVGPFVAEIDEMLTEVVDRLASASVSEVVDRERRRQLVPYGRWGHLRSVLAARDLTQDSLVRWVTVAPRMQPLTDEPDPAGQDTDVTRVLLADRVLRLPTRAVPTVAAISTALDGIRIADLPGLDPASRLVVVRRLIREGACVLVSP